jgi:hypothetical protein
VPSEKQLQTIARQVAGVAEPAAPERPKPGELYEARWPITYGPPAGERGETLNLSRGQVFTLQGYPNDEKLVRLGYIEKAPKRLERTYQCRECKSEFISERLRDKHGYERHEEAKQANPHAARLYQRTHELMDRGRVMNFEEEMELRQLREAATAWDENREARPYQEAASQTPLHLDRTAASMR